MKIKYITTALLMMAVFGYSTASMAASCTKQGSSISIDTIKRGYKNCINCGSQKSGGKTVYFCYCGDGCQTSAKSSPSFKSSALNSVLKQVPNAGKGNSGSSTASSSSSKSNTFRNIATQVSNATKTKSEIAALQNKIAALQQDYNRKMKAGDKKGAASVKKSIDKYNADIAKLQKK